MKVNCLQENLNKGLDMAKRIVRSKTTLPITECVLISAGETGLKIQATDLSTSLTTWVPAMVQEEGEVAIPLRILSDFVNTLPHEMVELTLPQDDQENPHLMTIKCEKSKAHINGCPPEHFPPMPEVQQDQTVEVNPAEFSTAISRTDFCAASAEDNRPVLTGINIKIKEQEFTMAGADGFRLAVQRGALDAPVEEEMELNIPAKFLTEMNRIKGGSEEQIRLGFPSNRKQAMVKFQAGAFGDFQVEMTSQMLEGLYPNYEDLIPKNNSVKALFNHQDLLQGIKSTSIFTSNSYQKIIMELQQGDQDTPSTATVSGSSEEEGDSRTVMNIPEMEGGDLEISFNHRFISEMLKVMDKQRIRMETSSGNSPSLFMLEDSEEYLHIVMPMMQ